MESKSRGVILVERFAAIVAVVFLAFMLSSSVFAQATETLVIHFKDTEVLTGNNINVTKVENRVKEMFGTANVGVTFCTGNESAGGHVTVTFSNSSYRDGVFGRRITAGTRNVTVYVPEILKKFNDKMKGATAQQNASIIALIAAHEAAEVYLEDIRSDGNNAHVMESKRTTNDWWNDAQNASCGWPTTGHGSAALLRQRISQDKAGNKSSMDYHRGEDEVVSIDIPDFRESRHTFVATVYGEGWTIPCPDTYVSFHTYTKTTNIDGEVTFYPPYVTEATPFEITAYRDDMTLASVWIVIVPRGVGGVWVPVDKLALLAPYIGLASTLMVATAAIVVYVKRVKRRKEKQ